MVRSFPPRRPFDRRRRKGSSLEIEAMEDRLLPSLTILVNTAADENTRDNTLSLREAIELSNGTLSVSVLSPAEHALVLSDNSPGPNTIDFDITPGGVQTIAPTSALPTITAPVVIDGTSQPGYNPSHPAEIWAR